MKYLGFILFLFTVITLFSGKSQNSNCEYTAIRDTIINDNVYRTVDEMPTFIGKDRNLGLYVAKRFYDNSLNVGLQFSVNLQFVIDKDGNLIGARIYHKKEDEYTKEESQIINIIKSSPKWKPGICSNKKVNVLISMRLRYIIDENGRLR